MHDTSIPQMKRLAITGSSGYLGSKLVEHYRGRHPNIETLGIDIVPPPSESATPHEFVELDICDPEFGEVLRSFAPDAVIHSAFVVAPMRNERKMRKINVEGCKNVLAAIEKCEVSHFMFVSSTTAFGALPDNPIPLDESKPVRASAFRYALDKVEDEKIVAEFAEHNPDMVVSCVRPSIIGGPGMSNYLYRFIFGLPFMVLLDDYDTPLQFVHEDDVVAAIDQILEANARGAFNIAPPSSSPLSEIAEISGRRWFSLPGWMARFVHGVFWNLRLPFHESPVDFLHYARWPWVAAPDRLENELGFRFRYTSNETVAEIVTHCQGRNPRT